MKLFHKYNIYFEGIIVDDLCPYYSPTALVNKVL